MTKADDFDLQAFLPYLLNQAAASDTIRRAAEDARQAAMAEQSQASDQFLSAIHALVELHGTAQVSEVLTAVVA
mgnify:CR=1 FL=1